MLSDIVKKFPWPKARTSTTASFENILAFAREVAEGNPETGLPVKGNPLGLIEIVSALVRPIQAEHMVRVMERPQYDTPQWCLNEKTFFFDIDRCQSGRDKLTLELDRPTSLTGTKIMLAAGPILPEPMNRSDYAKKFQAIGPGGARSPWKQDINHKVSVWLPWGIAFVRSGNHSIAFGVLAGQGDVTPYYVQDMTWLLEEVYCDGQRYIERATGRTLGDAKDQRRAALFEVGRLMHKYNVSTFSTRTKPSNETVKSD